MPHDKRPEDFEIGSPYTSAAMAAAVVGDLVMLFGFFISLPLFVVGIGFTLLIFVIFLRIAIGYALVLYSFWAMDGPRELKEYVASTVEAVLNPLGILFSPRIIMMLAGPLVFIPFSLTTGLFLASLMQIKIVRFTAEFAVGLGVGKLTGKAGAKAVEEIAETETEKAVAKAGTKLAPSAAALEGGGVSGRFVPAEGLGSEEWMESEMERSANWAEEYEAGWKEQHSWQARPRRIGESPGALYAPSAAEAGETISETAFGMPEGAFEAMEHEALPEEVALEGARGATRAAEEEVAPESLFKKGVKRAGKTELESGILEKLADDEEGEEGVEPDLDLRKSA